MYLLNYITKLKACFLIKGISNYQLSQGKAQCRRNILHVPVPLYNYPKITVLNQVRIAYYTGNRVLREPLQHGFKICNILYFPRKGTVWINDHIEAKIGRIDESSQIPQHQGSGFVARKINYSIQIPPKSADNTRGKIGNIPIGQSIVRSHQLNIVLIENPHSITGYKIRVGQIQISQYCSNVLLRALYRIVYSYLTLTAAKSTGKYCNNSPNPALLQNYILYIIIENPLTKQ